MTLKMGDWQSWVVVVSVMLVQWLCEQVLNFCFQLQVKITLDVLENMKTVSTCKECVRNIFTNLAIVAALIMTIAFAMLFLADHLEVIDDDDEVLWLVAHGFIAATGYACLQSMRAMVESVLNLIYTEALTSEEIIRFLIHGPGAIGAPVIAIIFSMVSILVASALYILGLYSVAAATGFLVLCVSRLVAMVQFWLKRAAFTTARTNDNAAMWTWAEDPNSSPPKGILKKCSDVEIQVMRQRARHARQEELKLLGNEADPLTPMAARERLEPGLHSM